MRPGIEWLREEAVRGFRQSRRKSLLVTGAKGRGKTTLIQTLTAGRELPGVRSFLQRDREGQPERVILESRLGREPCVIGQRTAGKMQPVPEALDTAGVALLEEARRHPSLWVVVDEIGFLEESAPLYRQALLALFEAKRVVAALRKADTPFLSLLREREDCMLIDLDEMEEQG